VSGAVARDWWRADEPAAPEAAEQRVPLWGLVLFTIIVVLSPQEAFPALGELHIARAAAVLAVIALLVAALRGARIVPPYRGVYLVGALAAWAVTIIPFSVWPGGCVQFVLDTYLKTVVVFWLVTASVTSVANLRRVAWVLSLTMIPLAIVAVRNYLSGVYIEGSEGEAARILVYQANVANDPNSLALMLNLIMPLSIGLLFGETSRGRRVVLVGAIVVGVWAVIATFSRGGFVTLAVIGLVYLWKLRGRSERGWVVAAIIVALMALPAVPDAYWERLGTIIHYEEDPTGSSQARWENAMAAIAFVSRHPLFGAGIGMDNVAVDEIMGNNTLNVHNVFLQHAVDLGLPGLALFVWLVAETIRSATWSHRRSAEIASLSGLSRLAEAIQISLLAFVVGSQFHPVAFQIHYYYIAGLALAVKGIAEAESAKASPAKLVPPGA